MSSSESPRSTATNSAHEGATFAVLEDLFWYFSYAEEARHARGVLFLPGVDAMQHEHGVPTYVDVIERARELAASVEDCLEQVDARHASVLRTCFTQRPWSRRIDRAFGTLAPLVVRLAGAKDPWPPRHPGESFEESVTRALSVRISRDAAYAVALRKEADALLTAACQA